MKIRKVLLTTTALITSFVTILAQNTTDSTDNELKRLTKLLEGSSLSSQIFLGFRYYEEGKDNFNEFSVKRGYITIKKSINKYISGRITPDITIDQEGDGMGDVEMRLKYCYMEFKNPGGTIFTDPSIVFGQVFTPWIEFEEKINEYRVQGTHYLDRLGIVSSADFGIAFTTLLGGKIDETYQTRVNNGYPGRYGSIALGIYNGGGYHAIEENKSKTFQWRASIRPFPDAFPGLQVSYTGAYGKGNTNLNPVWSLQSGAISYEYSWITFSGQLFSALGDFSGLLASDNGNSYRNKGYSIFSEVKLFQKKFSLFTRYDYHVINRPDHKVSSNRLIGGIAYHIFGRNKIVLDLDHLKSYDNSDDLAILELMVELAL